MATSEIDDDVARERGADRPELGLLLAIYAAIFAGAALISPVHLLADVSFFESLYVTLIESLSVSIVPPLHVYGFLLFCLGICFVRHRWAMVPGVAGALLWAGTGILAVGTWV